MGVPGPIRYDKQRYRGRHLIENAFCRLKDFRCVATRYNKLAANFLSGVALATAIALWLVARPSTDDYCVFRPLHLGPRTLGIFVAAAAHLAHPTLSKAADHELTGRSLHR